MGTLSLKTASGGAVVLNPTNTATDFTINVPAVNATLLTDSSGIMNIGSGQLYKDASGNVLVGTTSASVPSTTGYISTANTFGFKNRIINGAMMIDQRNAGASVTLSNSAFAYGVDRWAGVTGAASSSTVTMQRVAIGANGFQYGLRILRGSGTYTGPVSLIQEPESANTSDLAGQTISISFWARKGSTSTVIAPYLQLISGTGTDQGITGGYNATWTGWSSVGTYVYSPTTTLTQYTTTFNVPSNSTEIALLFSISSYSGTGSANDYIDITGVQLEKGSTATAFDVRPYGTELSLCQRYYEAGTGLGNQGYASSTTSLTAVKSFSSIKRVSPTIAYNGTTYVSTSTLITLNASQDGFTSSVTGSGVGGNANFFTNWAASAEL